MAAVRGGVMASRRELTRFSTTWRLCCTFSPTWNTDTGCTTSAWHRHGQNTGVAATFILSKIHHEKSHSDLTDQNGKEQGIYATCTGEVCHKHVHREDSCQNNTVFEQEHLYTTYTCTRSQACLPSFGIGGDHTVFFFHISSHINILESKVEPFSFVHTYKFSHRPEDKAHNLLHGRS